MTKQKVKPKKKPAVKLLSGGNPQIAKGDGDAPVKAYIEAIPEKWKRDICKAIDKVAVKTVPKLTKQVRWNSPMYGVEGNGVFLGVHVFARYIKAAFFRGTQLDPLPPDESKDPNTRYWNIHEGQLDEAKLAKWIKQAAALPGWIISGAKK